MPAEILDNPINRKTINELRINELDEHLAEIRERRLVRVRQLEAIAKVKADEQALEDYMRFEKAYTRAKNAIERLSAQEEAVAALVNKARAAYMDISDE